jgi:hypothetical protein
MFSLFLVFTLMSVALATPTQYTSTASAAVAKAKATALTESPTSNVAGKTFDRFVSIFCENTDYSMAAADRKTSHRSTKKVILTTSQPDSNGLRPKVFS